MPNEVKLQEGHPVGDNLRPLKVGGERTSIELAKNGARINGDLELRGDAGGDTTTINCKKVIISENYSDTEAASIKSLRIGLNKEGATTSNNTIIGCSIGVSNTTPTDGNNSMYGIQTSATLTHAADAGVAIVYGGYFSATGSLNGAFAANEARAIHAVADGSDKCYGVKAVSGGSGTNYGVHITCSSSGATNKGLYINSYNGGADFTNQSSASVNDYFTLNTIADGETTLTTVESGGGSTAHLNMVADGNFTVDAAGDISLDADGHVEFDNCAVGFDKLAGAFSTSGVIGGGGHSTDIDFRLGNKYELELTDNMGATDKLNLIFPATSGNFILVISQDGNGSRTVHADSWTAYQSDGSTEATNAAFADGTDGDLRWAGGSAPTLTTTADKADIVSIYWDADNQTAFAVASLNF